MRLSLERNLLLICYKGTKFLTTRFREFYKRRQWCCQYMFAVIQRENDQACAEGLRRKSSILEGRGE